jgi:hypothetical protein
MLVWNYFILFGFYYAQIPRNQNKGKGRISANKGQEIGVTFLAAKI